MKTRLAVLLAGMGLVLLLAACSSGAAAQPTDPAPLPTQPAAATPTSAPVSSPPTGEPAAATQEAPAPVEEMSAPQVFVLIPGETEARFLVNEVLNGNPKTVVGTTQSVEGSLTPDFATPSNTTAGPIRVDLSTLRTDSSFRNRAIQERILESANEAFRYAEFVPTALTGLPETITIGEAFNFQITGNLTLHGVTREVTFDVQATPVSESRIEGLATLHILYSDFDIAILRLPREVASVEESVILELEFAAAPQ